MQGSETFTDTFSMFGPDPCVDTFVTGIATQSGTAEWVDPPSGGTHVHVDFTGRVDLYEANGPGPWDPQPGAFVGTWTYEGHVSDQAPPTFKGAVTGVTSGDLALADGRVLRRKTSFHLRSTRRAYRRRCSSRTSPAREREVDASIRARRRCSGC